jgi:hypothetical protein
MASNTCVSSPCTECNGPAKLPNREGSSNQHQNTNGPQLTSNSTQPLENWYHICLQLRSLLQTSQPHDLSNDDWAMLSRLREDLDRGLGGGQIDSTLEQRLQQLPESIIRYLREYSRYEHFVIVGHTTSTSQAHGADQNNQSGGEQVDHASMQYGGQ